MAERKPANSTPRERSDAFVERSKAMFDIGRLKDAEAQARRAVAEDPEHARAQLQLASVLCNVGRGAESDKLAKAVLGREAGSSWALRILASNATNRGDHSQAVWYANEAVRAADGDSTSLLALSSALKEAGDLDGASHVAEQLVAAFPEWAYSHYQVGVTRHSPEQAALAYREALRLDPTSARTRNNLGFAYARAGDFVRSSEQFPLAGTPAEAKNNLGYAYESTGNLAQAYEAYAEALRLDPALARARKNLAEVSRRLGRPVPNDVAQDPASSKEG
jgi:Flp pilus assembly protein TadD